MDSKGQAVSLHDAFISYSRLDREFCKKLQKALSEYKPPKHLDVPQRHLRIFLDEQDFTGAEYYQSLDEHLEDSAKLIVLCSPHARYSSHPINYVDDEIRRFAKKRGAKSIIPLLLSGIPNNEAKPGQEDEMAFPQSLCEVMGQGMPLASDYRGFDLRKDKVARGRFEDAWYKTLANIYGTSRREIEQQERKRRVRRRAIISTGVSAAILILGVLIAWGVMERHKAQVEQQLKEDERLSGIGIEARRLAQTRGMEIKALMQGMSAIDRKSGTGPPPPRAVEGIVEAVYAARRSLPVKVDETGVTAAELSPDGALLLTAGLEGAVRTRDSQTGALRHNFPATEQHQPSWSASFSPDGQTIVTGTAEGAVDLWEAASGKRIHRLASVKTPIWRVQFSPDGKRVVAGAHDGHLRLWSAATGTLLADQVSHASDLRIVQFSPDGQMIATARWNPERVWDGRVRLWDGRTAAPLLDLLGHKADVRDLVWVRNGKALSLLTGSFDGTVRQWDVTTGKQIAKPYEHKAAVYAVAFSHSYELPVSGGEDGNVILWTSPSPSIMSGHTGAVYDMAPAKNGDLLATAGNDGTVRIWSLLPGYSGETKRFEGHSGAVTAVSWSRDDQRLVSAGDDGEARVWSLEATKPTGPEEAIGWACNVLRGVLPSNEFDIKIRAICEQQSISK